MKTDPVDLGRRYLPFLVVAAVLALLVAITPTKTTAGPGGAALGVSNGEAANGSGTTGALGTNGSPVGGNGAAGAVTGGATGGVAGGPGGTLPASGVQANGKPDLSNCAADGYQKPGRKVFFFLPPCVPKWHGGSANGGNTMTGVTSTDIRYTFYVPQANPVVNKLLDQAGGFAESPDQYCHARRAFQKTFSMVYETYGRRLVPLDGPGNHAGSKNSSSCSYPYYQSGCNSNNVDPACLRAEADEIASMKPAFVIVGLQSDVFFDELAKKHIVALASSLVPAPRSYFLRWAPYVYTTGFDGDAIVQFNTEYYCKKLAAGNAVHAGSPTNTMRRHIGIAYPSNQGDPVIKVEVDKLISNIKRCGGLATEYGYPTDVSQAESTAQTMAASMQKDGVTTVTCYCDPVSPAFFQEAAYNDHWYPEWYSMGLGNIDSDPACQTYELVAPGECEHFFGLGNLPDLPPETGLDYHTAYKMSGEPGEVRPADGGDWGQFQLIGAMVQMAGPQLNPRTITQGLLKIPAFGGWLERELPASRRFSVGTKWQSANPWGYTSVDMREIWWNNNATSRYNGSKGVFCGLNGGQRYQLGQFRNGPSDWFDPKNCSI